MAPVHLVASSDEFLLAERVREVVRAAGEAFGGVEPEILSPENTPEDLATALCSPSLFEPQRVLVAPEVGAWVVAGQKGKDKKTAETEPVDTTPVERVLEEGLSEDVTLVLGMWCPSKPKGPLIDAVVAAGKAEWLPAPEAPKPWEDVAVSGEQDLVLRDVVARTVGDVRFTDGALKLLIDRLGYAPRLLTQEAQKLAAAQVNGAVDEDLVRALCFPKERSLEAVRDAVQQKTVAPILDLFSATEAGIPVLNWQGQVILPDSVAIVIAAQTGALFQQMLYLRRLVARHGMESELMPGRTSEPKWYPRFFKNELGPTLIKYLKADAPSPIINTGKRAPTPFALGKLFKGASRYSDGELVDALAALGGAEASLRGNMSVEALSIWLTQALGGG